MGGSDGSDEQVAQGAGVEHIGVVDDEGHGSDPTHVLGERGQFIRRLASPLIVVADVVQQGGDKVRMLDMTLAEFEQLINIGEVIEEVALGEAQTKELTLVVEWLRPLHVVIVVDDSASEERIVTVYEPDPDRWSADFRRRR
jgi:hypothetical protein